MGVISAVPLLAFFGFGVLSKDDFNGFHWSVVMLAQGGLAVGECGGQIAAVSEVIQLLLHGPKPRWRDQGCVRSPKPSPPAGEAVKSSGLLQAIAERIQELTAGHDLFLVRH